jgi:Asp-tRNA(Asn)/Glu-tRNA(Gln) amidotransferase A subunit family amidase
MLASVPASMLNQIPADSGIPRFCQISSRSRGLRVALRLDEPSAPVDATVEAAVRKAALMLDEAGAIVDESARPAFSF